MALIRVYTFPGVKGFEAVLRKGFGALTVSSCMGKDIIPIWIECCACLANIELHSPSLLGERPVNTQYRNLVVAL